MLSRRASKALSMAPQPLTSNTSLHDLTSHFPSRRGRNHRRRPTHSTDGLRRVAGAEGGGGGGCLALAVFLLDGGRLLELDVVRERLEERIRERVHLAMMTMMTIIIARRVCIETARRTTQPHYSSTVSRRGMH
jgi:hypothetical protein